MPARVRRGGSNIERCTNRILSETRDFSWLGLAGMNGRMAGGRAGGLGLAGIA